MAVTPELWSINGLKVELGIYREKLAQDLATLKPDVDDKENGKRWLMARVVKHLMEQGAGSAKLDRTQEDARLKRFQADKLELELAQRRGEMIRTEDLGEYLVGILMAFRAKVLGAPKRLAPVLLGKKKAVEVQALIEKDLHQALNELAGLDLALLKKDVRKRYKMKPDSETAPEARP